MAPVDCGLHGYATCASGHAKRETKDEQKRRAGLIILTMCLVVFIALCVAGIVARRIWRKSLKTPEVNNNDIELAVVPQRATPEPTIPQPVANPGRRRSLSAAPPPYCVRTYKGAEGNPVVNGMEHTDSKK
ncbi:hypothetical protein LA080_015864 [Diaporthe eres]|nr:hypothetical protein LA080_015864 [Diaporthe eres]